MAKIRVMSNQRRVGRVGDTTYYVRDGEQIARQSRNNSNYGDSASRSEAQQRRRVKWANLVNFYKACAFWMPKAFENVKPGQTMYNKFMSLNINESVVGLTKDMAQSGCSVVERFQVAKGSLPMIELSRGDSSFNIISSIAISNAITSTTTIGQLAADIITNNAEFIEGDNLAIVIFNNSKDAQDYPFTRSVYKEITLSTASSELLNTILPDGAIGKSSDDHLAFDNGHQDIDLTMLAVIHTRKVSGSLKVSTTFIFYEYNDLVDEFSGEQWIQECIDSYGVDQDVPLDPSFSDATITSVTANGSAIRNAQLINGNQTVRVYGTGLDSSSFRFSHNNVNYTPLSSGADYVEFLCGDNGNYFIYLGDIMYMTFRIEGITVPDELPNNFTMVQLDGQGNTVNSKTATNTTCINYPHLYNENYPQFRLRIGATAKPFRDNDSQNYEGVNCTFTLELSGTASTLVRMTVTDTTKPAYLKYKGFICAVFNYGE